MHKLRKFLQKLDANYSHAGPHKEAPVHRLYIGNIHFNLSEEDIKAVFQPFGEIDQVQLQKEHDTGRSRGYGYIQYVFPLTMTNRIDSVILRAQETHSKN
jgi:RNA-binding protein 23/39